MIQSTYPPFPPNSISLQNNLKKLQSSNSDSDSSSSDSASNSVSAPTPNFQHPPNMNFASNPSAAFPILNSNPSISGPPNIFIPNNFASPNTKPSDFESSSKLSFESQNNPGLLTDNVLKNNSQRFLPPLMFGSPLKNKVENPALSGTPIASGVFQNPPRATYSLVSNQESLNIGENKPVLSSDTNLEQPDSNPPTFNVFDTNPVKISPSSGVAPPIPQFGASPPMNIPETSPLLPNPPNIPIQTTLVKIPVPTSGLQNENYVPQPFIPMQTSPPGPILTGNAVSNPNASVPSFVLPPCPNIDIASFILPNRNTNSDDSDSVRSIIDSQSKENKIPLPPPFKSVPLINGSLFKPPPTVNVRIEKKPSVELQNRNKKEDQPFIENTGYNEESKVRSGEYSIYENEFIAKFEEFRYKKTCMESLFCKKLSKYDLLRKLKDADVNNDKHNLSEFIEKNSLSLRADAMRRKPILDLYIICSLCELEEIAQTVDKKSLKKIRWVIDFSLTTAAGLQLRITQKPEEYFFKTTRNLLLDLIKNRNLDLTTSDTLTEFWLAQQ